MFSISVLSGCGIAIYDIIEYNDNIINKSETILLKFDNFQSLLELAPIHEDSLNLLEEKRLETLEFIVKRKKTVEDIGGYRGDKMLLNAFLDHIDVLADIMDNELNELIKLRRTYTKYSDYKKIPSTTTQKEDEIFESFSKKMGNSYNKVVEIHETFAKKYGYEFADEIDEVDEINKISE